MTHEDPDIDSIDDPEMDRRCAKLCSHYGQIFPKLGSGRHRSTFDVGAGRVLKVPSWAAGIKANYNEANYKPRHPENKGVPVAKCFLIASIDPGIKVLIMEKVTVVRDVNDCFEEERSPHWISDEDLSKIAPWAMHVDSTQVGYNSRGKLVAFDYGG